MKAACLTGIIASSFLALAGMTLPAQIYTSIYSFSNNYCGCPLAQLQTDGTALYGATTTVGGASSTYLFKVNPDGTGYVTLPTQNHSPAPGVVVSGIAVYALGPPAGPWLYKVYVDGTGFSLLGGASGASYGERRTDHERDCRVWDIGHGGIQDK